MLETESKAMWRETKARHGWSVPAELTAHSSTHCPLWERGLLEGAVVLADITRSRTAAELS